MMSAMYERRSLNEHHRRGIYGAVDSNSIKERHFLRFLHCL